MRASATLLVLAGTLTLPLLAVAASPDPLLAKIKAVGKEGTGNAEAAQALQELVELGPDALLEILAAFDDASPIAANWLRAAFDSIADHEAAASRPLSAVKLEAFVKDFRHNGAARRIAYERLERADPSASQRLLPGMLNDPGQELRRAAVGLAFADAQRLLDRNDKEAARNALRNIFASACDVDQVEQIARQLADLDVHVDLPTHLGFIRRWQVVGPFDNRGGIGFSVSYSPGKGAQAGWKDVELTDPPGCTDLTKIAKVDLNAVLGKHMGAVAYAFAAIESPTEQVVEIRAASPNAIKLFLNGKEIYSCEDYHRNARLDTHIGRGLLKAGRNEILVKICQNEQQDNWAQEWVFQARICDTIGGYVPVQVLPPRPTTRVRGHAAPIKWWRIACGLVVGGLAVGGVLAFRKSTQLRRMSFAFWMSFILGPSLSASDWPQFRGPGGAGVGDDKGLPVEWSIRRDQDTGEITASKNVRWVVDLPGRGLSSPVVAGDRVFVTACSGYRQTRLHVLCYHAGSGKKLWERQFAATGNTSCQPATNMAAPTPVTDGECVCTLFASGDLFCLRKDGNLLWYRSLHGDYPNVTNTTGLAASLVQCRDVLIVPLENGGESFAAGIDVNTGKNRWRIERSRANNWVTPLLLGTGQRAEVLFQSAGEIAAYNPATGAKYWCFQGKNLATIPSPAASDGAIFVPGDQLIALKPGEKAAPTVLWSAARLAPKFASPLIYQNRVYVLNGAGVLNCADAASGKLQWQQRLKGAFWASPVAADGKIYCVNDAGTTFVVAPSPDRGKLLGTNELGERIVSTPALAAGAIFLRSDQHLYCFSEKK